MPTPTTAAAIHDALTRALLHYDVRQEKRRGYNRYALGQYLQAAAELEADVARGADLRATLLEYFSGSLLRFVLKALDLAPLTPTEERAHR